MPHGYPSLFAAIDPPQGLPGAGEAALAPQEVAGRRLTHVERIRDFFVSISNRPSSTFAIRRGTGLARGALSVVLYQTHRAVFESTGAPGYERLHVWKVRDEHLEAVVRERPERRRSA